MEPNGPFSSQITFLNVRDYESGKRFASEILGLPLVYDIGWAAVYAASGRSYLGFVDHSRSELQTQPRDSMLVSLTTDKIELWHRKISAALGEDVSPIREVPGANLKSFFFTGPEGWHFEIQQFLLPELQMIF